MTAEELRKLRERWQKDPASITDEEFIAFSKAMLRDERSTIAKMDFKTVEEFNAWKDEYMNTPEFKQRQLEFSRSEKAKNLEPQVLAGLQAVLSAADIATGLNQVRSSERQLRQLRRPSLPPIPRPDELLNQQIYQAQDQTQGIGRTLAPYDAAVRDAYAADLATARTASAGQAGAYGNYAQAAANRRYRAGLDAIPLAENIRRSNQGRLDSLLNMRQQVDQQNFRNRLELGRTALGQYNLEAQALGQLGAAGRQNISNSFNTLATGMAPFISRGLSRTTIPQFVNQESDDLVRRSGFGFGKLFRKNKTSSGDYYDYRSQDYSTN